MPNIEDKSRHLAMVFLGGQLTVPASAISNPLDLEVAGFTQGFTFILSYDGVLSQVGAELTIILEESPDSNIFTPIPASNIAGTLPAFINTASGFNENNTALTLGVVRTERFIRATASMGGAGSSFFTLFGYGVTNVQPPIFGEGLTILI